MSAPQSSPLPAALEHLARVDGPAPVHDAARLLNFLELLPDPRGRRGRRYPLRALLGVAAASVLAGARSLVAIGEWIAEAPCWALRTLGFPPDPLAGHVPAPHPATLRRLLARLDGDALDEVIGAFLTSRAARPGREAGRRAVAVDGKTLRGSRHSGQAAVALLAAMEHSGSVLAQRQVADKSNEIPTFAPLLDTVDLAGAVVTADALHTQHNHGTYLRERDGHYLAIVKKTIPACLTASVTCPGATSPVTTMTAPAPTIA
ncbi:ISAs1 family transposase [Streptomyces sp. NPDC006739]|uniref:ISAs1 family transposase n=1 Tax=Streptomyces sp. NPDC006739 TaxID=3364763 RepID=UPI0036D1FC0C